MAGGSLKMGLGKGLILLQGDGIFAEKEKPVRDPGKSIHDRGISKLKVLGMELRGAFLPTLEIPAPVAPFCSLFCEYIWLLPKWSCLSHPHNVREQHDSSGSGNIDLQNANAM